DCSSAGDSSAARRNRQGLNEALVFGRVSRVGYQSVELSFAAENESHRGIAEMRSGLDERVQNRLELRHRSADDLEHIGGSGLLLQRFAQLIQEPGVLDGDDGLLREVRDQFDLLIGEWPDFLTIDRNSADEFVILEHRHNEEIPRTTRLDQVDDT